MLNGLVLPPAVQGAVERVGGPRRAAILGAGVATLLLVLGLAHWATAPSWIPVYSGLPLESVGAITERLDEEGLPYRLMQGGTELQVPSNELARARVLLAGNGLPNAGRPGLELFDQPSWGMTDFTQRVNYRRALEGELERTIGKMRGVEAAKVHVAMEESTGFRRGGRPAEASVVLRLRGGSSPSPEVVQGIAHLVASSVDGVDAERVTVLDDSGKLLSESADGVSNAALATRELKMRSEVERYLEAKAEQLVSQIVGMGNARVQISAEINFDRVERTVETVDPERQVLVSEQRSEIIPGPEGGAGSSNVANSYQNSRSIETFAGAVGNVRRLTVAVLVNDRKTLGAAGTEYAARSPEELARIRDLVQSAVGYDSGRGDLVSVVSVPFEQGGLADARPLDAWEMVGMAYRPALTLLALVFAFVIGLRLTRMLRTQPVPVPAALATGGVVALSSMAEPLDEPARPAPEEAPALPEPPPVPEPVLPPPGPTVRELVAEQILEQPEETVRLVRAWLKEG